MRICSSQYFISSRIISTARVSFILVCKILYLDCTTRGNMSANAGGNNVKDFQERTESGLSMFSSTLLHRGAEEERASISSLSSIFTTAIIFRSKFSVNFWSCEESEILLICFATDGGFMQSFSGSNTVFCRSTELALVESSRSPVFRRLD